jgi:hypothetical protein
MEQCEMEKTKAIRKLEERLQRRGMLQGQSGKVLTPPKMLFKTLGEEILWILNQEKLSLSVKELSNYLSRDVKIIGKVMLKLTATHVNLVKRIKVSSSYKYRANFNKERDIPTMYEMIRQNSTKKF